MINFLFKGIRDVYFNSLFVYKLYVYVIWCDCGIWECNDFNGGKGIFRKNLI